MTYKQKIGLFAGGWILFLIITYQIALSETIRLYRENNRLTEDIARLQTIDSDIATLQATLQVEQETFSQDTMFTHFEQYLLHHISQEAEQYNVQLIQIPAKHVFSKEGITVETYRITIEGSYKNTTGYIHRLSSLLYPSSIVSVSYQTRENLSSKHIELLVTIIIQHVKSFNNEHTTS